MASLLPPVAEGGKQPLVLESLREPVRLAVFSPKSHKGQHRAHPALKNNLGQATKLRYLWSQSKHTGLENSPKPSARPNAKHITITLL